MTTKKKPSTIPPKPSDSSGLTEEKILPLVAMFRNENEFPAGPLTAEVHPLEVENYKQGGWLIK